LAATKEGLIKEVDNLAGEILEISKRLFLEPELPKEEYKSAELVCAFLQEKGFQIERGIAGLSTAFAAKYKRKSGGPKIAFLAEYDALPKVGHGCGHNLIAASCAGAAAALARKLDGPAEIIVYGTPDEEYEGGKIIMAEAGVFRGLDAAMQVHANSGENVVGRSSTPHQTMVVSYHGKSAHTAVNASTGVNALNAVLIAFAGLHALQQSVRPGTRFPATITDGGGAPNAMPEFAQFRVHTTTLEPDYLTEIIERIKNCARAGALATGAREEIMCGPIYKKLIANSVLTQVMSKNMESLGRQTIEPPPASSATDVGNVSWECPTTMAWISLDIPDIPLHSREFAEATVKKTGQKATLDAAKLMALTAWDVLKNKELYKQMQDEFAQLKNKG